MALNRELLRPLVAASHQLSDEIAAQSVDYWLHEHRDLAQQFLAQLGLSNSCLRGGRDSIEAVQKALAKAVNDELPRADDEAQARWRTLIVGLSAYLLAVLFSKTSGVLDSSLQLGLQLRYEYDTSGNRAEKPLYFGVDTNAAECIFMIAWNVDFSLARLVAQLSRRRRRRDETPRRE